MPPKVPNRGYAPLKTGGSAPRISGACPRYRGHAQWGYMQSEVSETDPNYTRGSLLSDSLSGANESPRKRCVDRQSGPDRGLVGAGNPCRSTEGVKNGLGCRVKQTPCKHLSFSCCKPNQFQTRIFHYMFEMSLLVDPSARHRLLLRNASSSTRLASSGMSSSGQMQISDRGDRDTNAQVEIIGIAEGCSEGAPGAPRQPGLNCPGGALP